LSEWKPYQTRLPNESELGKWFSNGNGIAVVSGQITGSREEIDFDKPELFRPWCELVEEIAPGLVERLALVQTPSEGYHLHYRCAQIARNQKLAETEIEENGKKKIKTLIETRGEGGYILVPPSPAACHELNKPYGLLRGDLADVPEITPQERAVLLDCARSFNEYVEEVTDTQTKPMSATGNRPGDVYNASFTLQEWHELLTQHGWKKITKRGQVEYWQRPGKTGLGISATVNYKASNLFYVFSSNAWPFEPEKAYNPFAAYTFLEHGGDFKAAAKALAEQGYGEKLEVHNFKNGKISRASSIFELTNDNERAADILATLVQAPLTDAGNAECMAALYQDFIRP
jgi:hypothetical protein